MNLNKLKKYIPIRLKWLIKKIVYFGISQYCNVCKSNLRKFCPGGLTERVINDLQIIGAGFHEYDYCPVCQSSYRQRLVMAYLDTVKEPKPGSKMLHIAPEAGLHYIFKRKLRSGYICGDLEPECYSYYANPIKIDLTQIEFPDNCFDIIVCNHVLEHVPDDRKAMTELFRVLKPGGFAILQVPISLKLEKTFEDWSITSPEDRLKYYGQKDHVRIYAMDYVDRIKYAGFQVELNPAMAYSSAKHFNKMNLDLKEVLYIAMKG
jgi:SAM-dependent methyltransferase